MSGMQGTSRSEGGGAASERSPHEDPGGHEKFCSEEISYWTTDVEEWTFTGEAKIVLRLADHLT